MPKTFPLEILALEQQNDGLITCRLKRADGQPMTVRAGQFVMLHFEHDGKNCTRSYSIANRVDDGALPEIEFCIALVPDGVYSSRIKQWNVGDTVDATGPHGRFCLRPEQQNLVLVATGTGIAPYRSMLRQIETRLLEGANIDLLYGVKHSDDILYANEFEAVESNHPGFRFWRCVSREESQWTSGRVQNVVESHIDQWKNRTFFLCGNPNMVEDVKARLLAAGVDKRAIRTEAYT